MQKHKSSSSFTPFIDPRLLQVSPSTGSALNNVGTSLPPVATGKKIRHHFGAVASEPKSKPGSSVNNRDGDQECVKKFKSSQKQLVSMDSLRSQSSLIATVYTQSSLIMGFVLFPSSFRRLAIVKARSFQP